MFTHHDTLSLFAVCCLAMTASVGAQTPGASKLSAIPHEQITLPAKGSAQPGTNLGKKGSANVSWEYPGAPADGLDAMRITMSPQSYTDPNHNFVYWAYDSKFIHGETYYMGLQPNGKFGKTALFSVFGPESSSKSPECKSGADDGNGTSCHIHYPWELQHTYQFTVALVGEDAKTATWAGSVTDLTTQVRTIIGDITVSSARGYLRPDWAVTFDELFERSIPCSAQPHSEILFFHPVGYRHGQEYPGVLKSLNINSGCNPKFYSDNMDFVYIDEGY
jgi:hypothetical protein